MTLDELEAKALCLDPNARARLARKLLLSLENMSIEENLALWAEEAERRDREIDADPGLAVDGKDVIAGVRSSLRKR